MNGPFSIATLVITRGYQLVITGRINRQRNPQYLEDHPVDGITVAAARGLIWGITPHSGQDFLVSKIDEQHQHQSTIFFQQHTYESYEQTWHNFGVYGMMVYHLFRDPVHDGGHRFPGWTFLFTQTAQTLRAATSMESTMRRRVGRKATKVDPNINIPDIQNCHLRGSPRSTWFWLNWIWRDDMSPMIGKVWAFRKAALAGSWYL